ncbi:hypothetical protein G5C51_14355 [Streptomyces sp. A7024]|uniref:FUSC family protein n=1 Tax=Streptomyces coryli TaxID=1128680 RepID=A0A6G4TYV9_9ACTN|nr:aromatic acid exporter family protein [Streptomyces coryli]NGN65074.1 hypothetical protein [Streptomyces coryli]
MHSIRATAAPDGAEASWPERFRVAARASVAAVAAWGLCLLLPGGPQYPAAIAALLTVHPTVYQSVTVGMQYGSGCAIGALIAVPALLFGGPTWAALAVVVLLAMLAAGHSRLGHRGLHVPTTAVFVLLLGRGHFGEEVSWHLVAVAIGVVCGLTCNLLFPPLQLRPAEDALDRLRRELAGVLRGLGTAVAEDRGPQDVLGRGWREDLTETLRAAHRAVDRAHESLRWNPRVRVRGAGRTACRVDHEILDTLGRVADDVAALSRALDRRTPRDAAFRQRYARLLRGTAVCVRGCTGGLPHPVLPVTRRECERLADAADSRALGTRAPENRLLMILDRTLEDLGQAEPAPAGQARKEAVGV